MAMSQPVTVPDPVTLLPPLLAYLPTSFASTRPPPDLLPLLSPILRQRLHIHTSSSSTDFQDGWIRLLCWDKAKADKLKDCVENANFEPHPVSGEIEVGDIDTITYKRFDHETIKAHLPLSDWDLSAIYLWCTGSDEADGWRLAELLPFDSDLSRDSTWAKSLQEAEGEAQQRIAAQSRPSYTANSRKLSVPGGDEDDYWAMYDSTPGRTPARQHSINPGGSGATEDEYYARYGDVQPAMDNHDPDETYDELEGSSLNGNALEDMVAQNSEQPSVTQPLRTNVYPTSIKEEEEEHIIPVRQPSPSSPRSRAGSDTVEKLESQAEKYAASDIGIRHHIGYSIKSMYRLAKSAGIGRSEFEDMVQRELETLSILDRDD